MAEAGLILPPKDEFALVAPERGVWLESYFIINF